MRKLIIVLLLSIGLVISNSYAQEMNGYLKNRIELFNGEYTIDKGVRIKCILNDNGKCCFQEEFGEVCLDKNQISKSEIKKIDLFFQALKFPSENSVKNCIDGVDVTSDYSDGFHSKYVLSISKSSENLPVYVDIRFYFIDGGNRKIVSSSFSKSIFTKADNNCQHITISKKDIKNIISDHDKIKKYLGIDFYTSSIKDTVNGKLIFSLLSDYNESNYNNNIIEIDVSIPVDTEENWPNE